MGKKKRYLVWQQTCVLGTLNLYILKMHTLLGYIIPLLLHSAKQNEQIISTLLLEGFFSWLKDFCRGDLFLRH